MIHNIRKSPFIPYIILISPFVIIYLWLFVLSMDTAYDRIHYFRIMDPSLITRGEPMLKYIGYLLELITSNTVLKLILVQIFFILLLCITLYKYIYPKDLNSFSKCLLALLLSFATSSVMLGVQLRIGYATILFIYFLITFKKINLLTFTPILMHYGTVFAVFNYVYIRAFKIDSNRSFVIHSLILLIPLTILFLNIELVFDYIGIDPYYYVYLDDEKSFGRSIPFSAILYIALTFYIVFFIKDNSYYRYFCFSGLWLVYVGFFLKFFLAFKLLSPISFFTLIYTIKHLPRNKHPIVRILLIYIIMPVVFIYFAYQVNLI